MRRLTAPAPRALCTGVDGLPRGSGEPATVHGSRPSGTSGTKGRVGTRRDAACSAARPRSPVDDHSAVIPRRPSFSEPDRRPAGQDVGRSNSQGSGETHVHSGSGAPCRGRGPRADPPLGSRPARATPRPCGVWCRTPCRTTTSARCTAACRRSATSDSRSTRSWRVVAGYGPLQQYFDDPAVEEIWINEPTQGVRRPGRHRRADPDDPHGRRGARPRRAHAQEQRPAGRPQQPLRRRDPCRRVAAARRHPRHQPDPLAGQHPQVRRQGRPPRRPGPAGHAAAAGGDVPRGGRRERAQRPRRRRHAGRQDDPAQLPRCGHPAARAHRHVRGGLRAEDPAARRRRDAVPAAQPRGHRRDPAATARQGGAAHAAVADHRRRGASGGEPRPAHRPQQRRPGHVHRPRQQRPRGGHQDVHAPAARRRERLAAGSWCRRWPRPSTSSSTSPSSATGSVGSARSSPSRAGSRATSSRSPTSSSRARACFAAPTGSRRTARPSSEPGYDVAALLAQADS